MGGSILVIRVLDPGQYTERQVLTVEFWASVIEISRRGKDGFRNPVVN